MTSPISRIANARSRPAHALYYAALDAAAIIPMSEAMRRRIIVLLAETVERHRTSAAQRACAAFAEALEAGDSEAMFAAARAIAALEAQELRNPPLLRAG